MSRRKRNHFLLYMFQQDVDNMKEWVLQYPNKETGGDLFGLWSGEGDNAVIHVVLGPGRNCTHGDYHFYQDVDYLRKVGSLLTHDYMLGHIGEWHSHHQLKLDRPSEGDCTTIERNFPQGACGFFLMIANINKRHQVTLSPYVFKVFSGKFIMLSGRIQVVAERSPFEMVTPVSQIINEGIEVKLAGKVKGNGRQTNKMVYSNANSRDIRIESCTRDKANVESGRKTTCMGILSSFFNMDTQAGEEDLSAEGEQCTASKSVHSRDESVRGRIPSKTINELNDVQPRSLEEASKCIFQFQWHAKDLGQKILREILNELVTDITDTVNMQWEDDNVQNLTMTFKHRGSTVQILFPYNFPVSQAQITLNKSSKRNIYYTCNDISLFRVERFVNEIRMSFKNSV